ncbi:39S ribosomal protein L39, mitochondrial [Asbolus verrucosus]|uniref:39S ribosomal protein L39, mitochondrial n=1 Tax=Asbolus verrucosus TaxID=1661398 RepID=A0A482WBR5_ASBVE|nr:39S ribosomal protein L39, mitochondrial [Asbolus verrucosus]
MNTVNVFFAKPTLLSAGYRATIAIYKRLSSSLSEEIRRQNNIFDNEQKKQEESIGRVEKIEIEYEGPSDKATLVMNKNISTPFDCAKHLGETIADRSAVALLNNDTLWHMHKPLPDSCKLQFLHYNIPQPALVNKIFWRTCSFLLGAVANSAFKDDVKVQLHSFPSPNVRSGSFVYDVQVTLEDWRPTQNELKVLSIEMIKFCQQGHAIQCMDVSTDLALDLFRNNAHKYQQIPDIAAHNNGKITLFRAGHHIDISRGPMVTNTNHLGRITVANVIKLDTDIPGGPIYRFQGVALPRNIILNHFAYSLLEERARELNPGRIPGSQENFEDNSFVAQVTV